MRAVSGSHQMESQSLTKDRSVGARGNAAAKSAKNAGQDKRQTPRLPIERTVHAVLDDGAHMECTLSDVSRSGALLSVDDAEKLPAEFELVLRDDLRKWCRVMRRSEKGVGIKFVAAPQSTPAA